MKLTLESLLTSAHNYKIPLEANEILNSLVYNKKRNNWSLRLFNTFESIASIPALYTELNTSTLANHIDYVRTQSKKPLLFIKKQLIGTNTQKLYANVRYHHGDIKGHRDNRKTELIIESSELQEFIEAHFDMNVLDKLHSKLIQFFDAKLSIEYLTPQRLQLISEASELHKLDDSLEKTIAQLKCAKKLVEAGGL